MSNQQAGIESALERNRVFAASGGHERAVVFPNLRLFVITCLDPHVDPAHFLGLGLGDAMVVRNPTTLIAFASSNRFPARGSGILMPPGRRRV